MKPKFAPKPPEVPRAQEYSIGCPVFSVWSCAWHAQKDDLSDATIDNLGSHFGTFLTSEEAYRFLLKLRGEREYETGEEMETLFVIERRELIFSKFWLPEGPAAALTSRERE